MKRMINLLRVVAVAAVALTSCQNNFEEVTNEVVKGNVVVNFVTESTRTSVDTTGDAPIFSWSENETFAVLEQTDALAEATNVTYENVDGKASIKAELAANPGKGAYQYVVVYPEAGFEAAESLDKATLALPAEQTMAEESYDPTADLMVSMPVQTTAQPTEAQYVRFARLAAVAKMTVNNLNLGADEQIERVEFTADGKPLAGTINVDLTNPEEFTADSTLSTVSVATTSADAVYFTLLPTTLEAGDVYSVAVVTNKKVYIKPGSIPEGKSLVFEAGKVSRFSVNMTDVVGTDKWTLVRDASTLKEGDVVAIVAKDYDKALSTKLYNNVNETSTSARRAGVDISKIGNFMISNENVQQLILVDAPVKNTFSFYDKARGKFLVTNNNTSRYLINQPYMNKNTSFNISIDNLNGDATVKNIEGDYNGCMIRYYNSSTYFYSGTSANQAITIYRLEGAVGEIPVVAANVTVPDSDEVVTIAEEGAAEATAINDVVFNYVGPWAISVSDNAEWLNVAYDAEKNCLTYTADANTGAKRETTVTITATLEGQESLTWSFNLVQKGAPQEISIADFVTKGQDVNTTYKLTGRITEMTSSSSGTYKLTDDKGNIATVTYVYTDAGDKLYGDDSIVLKVGDVMTVTTVVTSTTKGKGGSSSYHSIYKGHYGFSALAGIAADYTGGSVNIEVKTYSNGNIAVPEAVVATMAENDFAELSYDGGNSATVTFKSENTTSDAREAEVTFTYGMTNIVVVAVQGVNPANKRGYELVTDASTLAIGDEVIIVSVSKDKALGCIASSSSVTGVSTIPAVDIVKTGNVIYDVEDAGVMLLTLKAGLNDGEFAFQFTHKDVDYYINAPSSGLKGRAASSGANNSTSYAITIDANGKATVQSTYPRIIKFNSKTATNFTAFKLDADGATLDGNHIAIYKKQK